MKKDKNNCGTMMIYMLDMLFQLGCLPKIAYEDQVRSMNQPYKEVESHYIGRVNYIMTENEKDKKRISFIQRTKRYGIRPN